MGPDFGVIPKIKKEESKKISPEPLKLGEGYPSISTREKKGVPWKTIFFFILLGLGIFLYMGSNDYFKSEINQSQSVEPQITVSNPVQVENDYIIQNNNSNPILNNVTVNVWIDGTEVQVDLNSS